eukprot:4535193-Ditylum_brightwellii.AAC.2
MDQCPQCHKAMECRVHLFLCMHETAVTSQTTALIKLKNAFYQSCTSPVIKETTLSQVVQFCGFPYAPYPIPTNAVGWTLGEALTEQSSLGWLNFMKGRVSKK